MKEAEGNEVGEVRRGESHGHRGKWRIVLFAALVVAAMAWVFCFRQQGLREQLRAMAGESGVYHEEVRGPRWYVKLAEKYKLPIVRRPSFFRSATVTDEDMAVIGRANTLREVWLLDSHVSDAGLAHLAGLRKLQYLTLYGDKFGDAGLAHLSELTELRSLYLFRTKVSDAGLVHLKKLKNLQSLILECTEVTDAGLVHLKSLKGLTSLGLLGTRVTAEGVADLKSAMPNVEVSYK